MNPRSTSVRSSLTVTRSPTSSPSNPRTTRPSTGGRSTRTQVPFAEAPVTKPSNVSPIRARRSRAAADFLTCRSTLAAASSATVQCCASAASSSFGIRRRLVDERRLDQTLREEIGKPSVRRGRVGVVPHGQPEVLGRALPGRLEGVLAATEQLHHRERQIGKVLGVGPATLGQEVLQRARVGLAGQLRAVGRRELDDPLPALGGAQHPPHRRESLLLQEARGRDVRGHHEVLDQLLGAILLLQPEIRNGVSLKHRARLQRLQLQRAVAGDAAVGAPGRRDPGAAGCRPARRRRPP